MKSSTSSEHVNSVCQTDESQRLEALLTHLKDKAESAARTKDTLLANLSHELRTPLNAIIGFSTLMLEPDFKDCPDLRREHLQRIQKAGKHLLGLVNDLLGYSMMETKRGGPVVKQPIALTDLVMGALILAKPLAEEKSISIFTEFSRIGTIYADRGGIMQVMANLINNAVKFTGDGGRIGVKCEEIADEVLITVWDTGIGISPDKLTTVFDEFKQVDENLSRRFGGIGLGLAIARRIMVKMGGRIWAESQLGVGSRFYVVLPASLKRAPDVIAQKLTKPTTSIEDSQQKRLILAANRVNTPLATGGLDGSAHTPVASHPLTIA